MRRRRRLESDATLQSSYAGLKFPTTSLFRRSPNACLSHTSASLSGGCFKLKQVNSRRATKQRAGWQGDGVMAECTCQTAMPDLPVCLRDGHLWKLTRPGQSRWSQRQGSSSCARRMTHRHCQPRSWRGSLPWLRGSCLGGLATLPGTAWSCGRSIPTYTRTSRTNTSSVIPTPPGLAQPCSSAYQKGKI